MRSYARYWLEAFRLPVMPAGRLVGGMRDTGHVRAAFEYLAAGRGVVFALPHMGNWDQAGAWIIASGPGYAGGVVVQHLVRDAGWQAEACELGEAAFGGQEREVAAPQDLPGQQPLAD